MSRPILAGAGLVALAIGGFAIGGFALPAPAAFRSSYAATSATAARLIRSNGSIDPPARQST